MEEHKLSKQEVEYMHHDVRATEEITELLTQDSNSYSDYIHGKMSKSEKTKFSRFTSSIASVISELILLAINVAIAVVIFIMLLKVVLWAINFIL